MLMRLSHEIQADAWDDWIRQIQAVEQGAFRAIGPYLVGKEFESPTLPSWAAFLREQEVDNVKSEAEDKMNKKFTEVFGKYNSVGKYNAEDRKG